MATLPESNTWEFVRQWETTDPALGGAGTLFTAPVQNLTNRTKYLKTLIEAIIAGTQKIIGTLLNGSVTENVYTSYQQSNTAVASTAFVQGAVALKSGRKNLLLNGDMAISQRGTSFSIGADETKFTMDRWMITTDGSTGAAIAVEQNNDALAGLLDAFKYAMKIDFLSATTGATIRQRISNGRVLENSKGILQFILWLDAACSVRISLRRFLDQSQIDADTPEWEDSEVITAAIGVAQYTKVFNIDAILTNVPRAIGDDGCLEVSINLEHAAGATLTAYLTNVQFEPGEIPSSFEERDDLPECLTYFEKMEIHERKDLVTGESSFFTRQYWNSKRRVPDLTKENETYINLQSVSNLTLISKNAAILEWKPAIVYSPGDDGILRMDLLIDAEI